MGGGKGGGRGLEDVETRAIEANLRQGEVEAARQAALFDVRGQLANASQLRQPILDSQFQRERGALQGTRDIARSEALGRLGERQEGLQLARQSLEGVESLAPQVQQVQDVARLQSAPFPGAFLEAAQGDITTSRLLGQQANALAGQANTLAGATRGEFNQRAGFQDALSNQITAGGQTTQQLGNLQVQSAAPIRGVALQNQAQALTGQTPTAVSGIFGDDTASAARERDVLELQAQAARNRLTESGLQGGALAANLGALETQRALGIAGQQSAREQARRNASLGFAQRGLETGDTAFTSAAPLFQSGSGQLSAAGGLLGNVEGQRLAATGQAGQLTGLAGDLTGQAGALSGQAFNQNQSSLQNSLSAIDQNFTRDLQGLEAQQRMNAQNAALAQNFAQQFGQGAEELLLADTDLGNQQLNRDTQQILLPQLGTEVLTGAPTINPSQFFSAAGNQASSVFNQQREAEQQNQRNLASGLFSLPGAFK